MALFLNIRIHQLSQRRRSLHVHARRYRGLFAFQVMYCLFQKADFALNFIHHLVDYAVNWWHIIAYNSPNAWRDFLADTARHLATDEGATLGDEAVAADWERLQH